MMTRQRSVLGLPLTAMMVSALAVLLGPQTVRADEPRAGQLSYRQRCASCHGAAGEGSDENYPHRLEGNRTVPQLTRVISRTMPKGQPKKCTPEEAQQVATYIYDTFYSRTARERNK